MAAPDHSGLADELVDAAGVGRMRAQASVPGAQGVALEVAEWLAVKSDNELIHIGMVEVAGDQPVLIIRLPPPGHDVRRFEPAPDHCKIAGRHRPKGILHPSAA